MDAVLLSSNSNTLDGLRDMMQAAGDMDGWVHAYVDVPAALLIVEVAKRAPDRPEWFPRGKWATIQSIQAGIGEQLATLVWPATTSGSQP